MKVVFIKARDKFQKGSAAEIEAKDYQALADMGYVVTASEWAQMEKAKESSVKAVTAAVNHAKAIGAILPKDEEVLTASLKRLEEGTPADVLVELIQAKHSKGVENALETRVTARLNENGQAGVVKGTRLDFGEVSIRDSIGNGYIKAREPMDKLIKAGNLKAAAELSAETARTLQDVISPIYAKGGDFAVRDIIKAADDVGSATEYSGSVGTLNTGLVLMRNLGFLKNKLNFLDKISTDLRNEPIQFGQNVLTRYITPPGVLTFVPGIGMTSDAATIAAWKATITASNPAGTPQTSGTQTLSTPSATDVSVVLNQYKGVEITFNNLTISSTMRNLFAEQQGAMIYGLAEQINKDFLTTVLGAKWTGLTQKAGQTSLSVNAASANLNTFGLQNVIAIKNYFSLNKLPDVMRFALLHSSYHDAILTDSNLLSAKAILALIKKDTGAFEDGELPVLFGVRVLESQLSASKGGSLVTITDPTTIPTVADTIGFAGNSASALFVARVPQDYTKILGEIPATAALEIVTEPDSGLSLLVTKRVDHNLQSTFLRGGLMYNFAQGDPRQGFLLTP